MIQLLTRMLEYPKYLIVVYFLRFWLLSLVAIVAGAWRLRGLRATPNAPPEAGEQGDAAKAPQAYNSIDWALSVLAVLIISCFIFLLSYKEDFSCFDCSQLTDYSVAGHRFGPPIWPKDGRFFPLGMQEFNLLRYVTRTPAGYQSIAATQVVILTGMLFALLKDVRLAWRALIAIAVIVTPSIMISFSGLIYPERNALFWLAILVLCLQRATSSNSPIYFLGCFVTTHFLLYYKEPLVVFVAVYAVSRLAMDFYSKRSAGQPRWEEFGRENIVPVGLMVVAGIYTVLFLVFMFPFHRPEFITLSKSDPRNVPLLFLRMDWLMTLLLVVLLMRLVRWLFFGKGIEPMWESLGLGAFGYFIAILAVGVYTSYYLAPVDLIAILYVGRLAASWAYLPFRWRVAAVGAVSVCLLVHEASFSALRIIERKVEILQVSELAKFLKNYKADPGEQRIELFFPFTDGFRLAGISSYLRYKGLRLAGQSNYSSVESPEFVIAGRGNYESGRCYPAMKYACKHVDEPGKGGLLVVLPKDLFRKGDLEQAGRDAVPLLYLTSWPEDSSIGRVLRLMQSLSLEDRYIKPQPWWQLYVFRQARTGN